VGCVSGHTVIYCLRLRTPQPPRCLRPRCTRAPPPHPPAACTRTLRRPVTQRCGASSWGGSLRRASVQRHRAVANERLHSDGSRCQSIQARSAPGGPETALTISLTMFWGIGVPSIHSSVSRFTPCVAAGRARKKLFFLLRGWCSNITRLGSVSARGVSADVSRCAHRRKAE
jgi:hypothetical protein